MSRIDIAKLTPSTPVAKPANGERAGAAEGQSRPLDSAASPKPSPQGVSVEVKTRIDAGQPPVDTDRVSEIRAALKDGSYPIVPTEIADALIAARLMMVGDQ